jgi:threonylcarbamoyladenosine tRNA methylthiotransferase CDKAL1
MKKVYIDTNGCDEARLDTQKLKNSVQGTDYVCTDDVKLADIIVFYACGHLQTQENESIAEIKRLMKLKKNSSILVVWGCLPEINPEAVKRIHTGPVVGPQNWDFFKDLFNQSKERMDNTHANRLCAKNKLNNSPSFSSGGILNVLQNAFYFSDRGIWYIEVASGCGENCTYCSDRLAFKHLKSIPMDEIISQFETGLKKGFKRFYLVGRDLGSYGRDLGTDLPTLLNMIIKSHPDQDYRLYLKNMSPRSLIEFYPRLTNVFSSGKVFEIGSHFQSGSERILKLMGRRFAIGKWLVIMRSINENFPNIRFTTSLIVGFPTETEEDFNKSIELLDDFRFDRVDVYAYAERPNLPSLKLGGRVPDKVKMERYKRAYRKAFFASFNNKIIRLQLIYLIQSLIFYATDFDARRARRQMKYDLGPSKPRTWLIHTH